MKTLDIIKHKTNLTNILIGIYKNSLLSSTLGFKGGTAAMLFYGLPRFSVDLDFDLLGGLSENSKELDSFIYEMTNQLSPRYKIKDQSPKYHTLFWLVNYETGRKNIKVEISTRDNLNNHYNSHQFYGVNIKVLDIEDMIAHKMIALTERKSLANRDLFDVHYFLSSAFAGEINYAIIKQRTDKEPAEFYRYLLDFVKKIKPSQKDWAKAKLIEELKGLIQRQIDLTTAGAKRLI